MGSVCCFFRIIFLALIQFPVLFIRMHGYLVDPFLFFVKRPLFPTGLNELSSAITSHLYLLPKYPDVVQSSVFSHYYS